jgi:hypothetical protein
VARSLTRRPSPARKALRARPWQPALEELESRLVPTVSLKILNGVLTAQCGDIGSNTVTVDHVLVAGKGFAEINGHFFADAKYNSIQINGGAGGTVTNVHGNVKPLTVFGGSAKDVVNLGDTSNKLQGIQAGVLVEDEKGFSGTLNINDQGDTTGHTATLSTVAGPGGTSLGLLTGLSAPIAWDYADTSAVNLHLGAGTGNVNVLGTGTTTNIFNSANAAINVGQGGSVEGIAGALNLENVTGKDAVSIFDQNDAAVPVTGGGPFIVHNVAVNTVTRPGQSSLGTLVGLDAPITWDYANTSSVTIDLGTVAGDVHVNGTGPLITNISFAAPNVTVEVGNGNVGANILGTLDLATPGGGTVNILDSNDTQQGQTATLAAVSRVNQPSLGQLSGLGSGVIAWDSLGTPQVFVVGGSGADTFNIQGTVVPTIITANGPATMNVGLNGSIAGIQSPLLLRNNTGPNNTVNINSQNDSHATTAVLSAVGGDSSTGGGVFSVQGLSTDIFFDKANTAALNLNLASGIVVVDNTVVPTSIFSREDATIDVTLTDNVLRAGIQANLTLENDNGRLFKDTINIDDSNDVTGRTYNLARVAGDEAGNTFEQFSSDVSPALITWDNADTRLATVLGGSGGIAGGNVWNIASTGSATTIVGGAGHNTFNVPPLGTLGSLGAAIVGKLTLDGNSGSMLNLNDQGDGASETFHFSIPSPGTGTLTLDSTPAFDLVFNNMGTVTIAPNLFSTVDDPSFTVILIPPPTL